MRVDSPEERFLLLCARPDSAACAPEIRRLLQEPLPWADVLRTAGAHGVVPLIRRAIADLDAPAALAEPLHATAGRARLVSLRWTAELLHLAQDFDRAGVRMLAFKGPTLGLLAYGDASLRSFNDLDLLVAPSALASAAEVLASRGFHPAVGDLDHVFAAARSGARLLPHEILFRDPTRDLRVDLHTSLITWHFALDVDPAMADRAVSIELASGRPVRTLAVPDLLLYLCAHGLQDGWLRLAWVADIAHLLHRHPELNLGEIRRSAAEIGADRLLLLGLGLAAQMLGVQLPDEVRADLEAPPLPHLVEQVRSGLFPHAYARPGVRRTLLHLEARERVRDRVRYLARLPGDVAIGDFASVRLPRRLFPLYYLTRPARLAWSYRTGTRSR